MSRDISDPSNFVCTDPINLKEYFDEFAVECSNFNPVTVDDFSHENAFLSKELDAPLDEIFSVDKLTVENELIPEDYSNSTNFSKMPVGMDRSKLDILNLHRCPLRWNSTSSKILHKYKKAVLPETHARSNDPDNAMITLDSLDDYIITIQVYNPFLIPIHHFDKISSISKIKCGYEIIIHSSQLLTALKDKLLCSSDIGHSREIFDINKYMKNKNNREEPYPSSYFFIEGCFYNDMRHPEATDTSEVVRKWAKTAKKCDYTTAIMEETKLEDITFRMHYPYLYQHQADCEHLMVFSDARLVNKSDTPTIDDYPYIKSESNFNTSVCYICQQGTAHFLVADSDRLPYKNTYMCETCMFSYNYKDSKHKERIGHFILYPYFDKAGWNTFRTNL